MDGSFSTPWVNAWLDAVADSAWISLHYDTPTADTTGYAEIQGGGYVRVQMTFEPASNRAIWSTADARFAGLTQNTLRYFGIWDAKTQGNLIAYAGLPGGGSLVLNGQGYIITAGDLSLSIG